MEKQLEARDLLRKAAKELGVPVNTLVPNVKKLMEERDKCALCVK